MRTLKVIHYQQLFANSDNDEEFEGFGLDDILDNNDNLNEIDFDQSLKDQEMIEDVDIGWERNDAVPICAPFTGNPGLNVELYWKSWTKCGTTAKSRTYRYIQFII